MAVAGLSYWWPWPLRNKQLTSADFNHFVRVFLDGGFGTEKDTERAEEEHGGLGLFLRSFSGLEQGAAAAAFDRFQAGRTFSSPQLRLLKLIIDYVAKNGFMDVGELYEPPFTGVSPGGPGAGVLRRRGGHHRGDSQGHQGDRGRRGPRRRVRW
ncbi:type I restriction-modification enzyme R subunit C-terminal domain-containing protein [Nocardiopsis flavescens]|uniref:type I restriction-modification enzyme R subunit C-terminal domain-containing protein n=1 Tax=Nocardiopsis flavescens TaxID=758803 RepID=UPI003647C437